MGPRFENGIWKLKSNKEIYEKIEKISTTMRKRRISFYGHLKRMHKNRLSKKIFDYFDKNPKTKVTWFVEVKKDISEMQISEEEILDRNKFREKIDQFKNFEERQKKKTGTKWTDERRSEHSERMKRYWTERKRRE